MFNVVLSCVFVLYRVSLAKLSAEVYFINRYLYMRLQTYSQLALECSRSAFDCSNMEDRLHTVLNH